MLRYLIENRDRVISKAELFDNVWGDRFVGESALTSRIKSIRSAFGDDGKKQAVIRTVHGMGYQFVAPLDPSMPGATPRQESAPRKGCYGLRASADSRPWARNRAARAVMMP